MVPDALNLNQTWRIKESISEKLADRGEQSMREWKRLKTFKENQSKLYKIQVLDKSC